MVGWLARRALSLYLLALTVSSGIVGLISPQPGGIEEPFPLWARTAWFGGLILGGTVAMIGVVIDRVRGLYVERAGLLMLSGLTLCVGIAALGYERNSLGWVGVIAVVTYGLCCLARSWYIGIAAKERALLDLHRELSP